ncbi:phage holin [Priestia megaterium]|uniref:phage holin n=1 Tax=Priestia megaterium TaxID=1404 RepID=UPI00366F31F2
MRLPNRFKNYALWVAMASLVLLVLQAFGLPIVEAEYNRVVSAVLSVLVLAGVINNPSQGSGFKDEDKTE